jgi:hypothetical protein
MSVAESRKPRNLPFTQNGRPSSRPEWRRHERPRAACRDGAQGRSRCPGRASRRRTGCCGRSSRPAGASPPHLTPGSGRPAATPPGRGSASPDQCSALVALVAGSRRHRHNGKTDSVLRAVGTTVHHQFPVALSATQRRRLAIYAGTGNGVRQVAVRCCIRRENERRQHPTRVFLRGRPDEPSNTAHARDGAALTPAAAEPGVACALAAGRSARPRRAGHAFRHEPAGELADVEGIPQVSSRAEAPAHGAAPVTGTERWA